MFKVVQNVEAPIGLISKNFMQGLMYLIHATDLFCNTELPYMEYMKE